MPFDLHMLRFMVTFAFFALPWVKPMGVRLLGCIQLWSYLSPLIQGMPLPYTSTQHKVVAKCMRFGFRV